MTDLNEWSGQVGSTWAEEWRRTDRSFGPLTDRLLNGEALGNFSRVVDVGCGAGELSLRIAAANPAAEVRGIDISSELLSVARERATHLPNVQFDEVDAATWRAGDFRPDLLVSRHGVMFFADPAAAFNHLRQQSQPDARLRFSCFRSREDNGWVAALGSVLPMQKQTDPSAPGPFAFADPARVEAMLVAAGWRAVAFEQVDYPMVVGEGAHALDDALAYFQRIGPAARGMADLPVAERELAGTRLLALLAEHCHDGRASLPAAAWIVTARAG